MKLPPPRATVVLVGACVLAWGAATVAGLNMQAALLGGFIPARWSGLALPGAVPAWLTPLSATLVHGGLIHIGFNMLMLGFCGRFVEVALRARGLIVLYVIGAYAAAGAQWLATPLSTAPMVGASGAISAVVGAYALLYGERRNRIATRWLADAVQVLWLAAAWVGLQLLVGLVTTDLHQSVAIMAHIGGFLAGLLLARPLMRLGFRGRLSVVR